MPAVPHVKLVRLLPDPSMDRNPKEAGTVRSSSCSNLSRPLVDRVVMVTGRLENRRLTRAWNGFIRFMVTILFKT